MYNKTKKLPPTTHKRAILCPAEKTDALVFDLTMKGLNPNDFCVSDKKLKGKNYVRLEFDVKDDALLDKVDNLAKIHSAQIDDEMKWGE